MSVQTQKNNQLLFQLYSDVKLHIMNLRFKKQISSVIKVNKNTPSTSFPLKHDVQLGFVCVQIVKKYFSKYVPDLVPLTILEMEQNGGVHDMYTTSC